MTSNSLDKAATDAEIRRLNDSTMKDMVAAAVSWECRLYGDTPFLDVKVVTDIVDDNEKLTQDEFLEYLHTASRSLQKALPNVLDFVCGVGSGRCRLNEDDDGSCDATATE